MVRGAVAAGRRRRESGRRHVPSLSEFADAFRDHDLLTYSGALAYRVLASLVPLTLLGLGLLGVLGLESVWRDSLGPAIQERVTLPVYSGIDHTVERIFQESAWPLIALAVMVTLWHVSRGIRIVMKALNVVHETRERRPRSRQLAINLGLAIALVLTLTAAFLAVVILPRLAHGPASLALHVVAWVVAGVLFAVGVGLIVRYAPAERPNVRWASIGSVAVVVMWVVTTAAFGWWAGSVADYKSAVGTLFVFLLLTAYIFASTTVFLAGVELDELARTRGRR